MKNSIKFLALLAIGVSAASCSISEVDNGAEVLDNGIFFSLKTGETKTYIVASEDGYSPMWKKGDEIGVLFEGFTKDKSAPDGTLTNSEEDGAVADFEGTIEGAPEEGTLYAFYPAKFAKTYDNSTVGFDILANQKPTATSFDPEADLLISKPVAYTAAEGAVVIGDVYFARALSMLKINVYSSDFDAIKGQFLSKLTVTAVGDTLAGRPVFDLTKGDAKVIANNKKDESSVSALYDEDIVKVGASKEATGNSVFLMVVPGTLNKDAKLKFEGETGGYTFSKEVTLPSDIALKPGKYTEINLGIAEGNCEEKVDTDYSGDYLIVSTTHLLTDFNSEKSFYNYVEADGTELSDFWEIANIEDYVWTVAKLADGSYSFCNSGTVKYLALTGDSNAAHQSDNADENTARFSIAAEESALTIYSKAYPERKLRCNTSSPRFAFYGSTSNLPVASLLAYTPDSRLEFDVVTGLAWDASGKTLSWTATDGATNGYEYTTDNGTTVTASETNSIDCASWSNGDYSVKVRVVGTEEKKTSQWSDACAFTISGGAEKSILSFDFVTHPTGWPIGKESAAEGSYNYTLEDETYTFTHSKSGDGIYCGGTSITSGYLMVAKSNTLGLPAIDGYKLTKVVGTLNGSGSPSTKSEVSITDGTDVITGGASQTWNTKGGSYTYNLTNTEENTVYYLSVSNTANCQITKLELTYEITSPLVSIAVSGTANKVNYSVGDSFDTDGLIVNATYADGSTKDVTNKVEWTVTPETLTAGTTSVKVVATYKGVTSNEYVVNGLSVKELSSISVKTAPTKTTYIEGEKFDPAGLVINKNYSDESVEEVAYSENESDFTFNPTTSTALTTSVTSVTITYSGKSVSQAITVNEKPALETMDAIFAAATAAGSTAKDAKVKFDSWVISGVKNDNAYLTDNNGKGLIIYTSGHGFTVGDILSGTVNCQVQLYNSAAELKSLTSTTEGLTVTKGGSITPATISIADLSGVNTGAVITFESLTYNGSAFSDGANTIKPYNTFISLPTLIKGRSYSVTGVYIQFGSTKEIAPREASDFVLLTSPYLNASASKTSGIAAAGETVTITVDTNIEGWTATSSDNTNFAISNKTATSFDVTVSENTSTTDTRSATITVSATGVESKVITLTQSKKSSGTGPVVGTVLWGENFAHFGTNIPSAAGTGTGTTIYGEASITYAQSSTNTKGYDEKLAGGTAPELLLSKSNQTWTISGIPCNGVSEMSLTFLSNKTTFAVSSSTDGITVSGSQKSWTITNTTASTFEIVIMNTGSSNARIDDVVLKVTAN